MLSFTQAIMRHVAPKLISMDYRFVEAYQEQYYSFSFQRDLGDDIQGLITFYRQPQLGVRRLGNGFGVWLYRRRNANADTLIDFLGKGHYPYTLSVRLRELLPAVLGVPFDGPPHVWKPSTTKELVSALLDAVDKLERYGAPWLEDRHSRNLVLPMPDVWDEFQTALIEVVSPVLQPLGYQLVSDPRWTGYYDHGQPKRYFVKRLAEELTGYILINPMQDLMPVKPPDPWLLFDVLLLRSRSRLPVIAGPSDEPEHLEVSLGQLNSVQPPSLASRTLYGYQSGDPEDLQRTLEQATRSIISQGIPLLES